MIRKSKFLDFEKPYFVPLYLDLDSKHAEILMRPKTASLIPNYEWSSESILEFNLFYSVWRWTTPGRNKIRCQRPMGSSAFTSLQTLNGHLDKTDKSNKVKSRDTAVILDSFLKLRNALPVDIDSEISDYAPDLKPTIGHFALSARQSETKHYLKTGECDDLIACDIHDIEYVCIRFRCSHSATWSSWTTISVRTDIGEASPFEARDAIVIRAENEGAVEWTIGLKRCLRPPTSLDFILFSELWIANFTDLSLVFGAPKAQ
jgi:hypothetical protein